MKVDEMCILHFFRDALDSIGIEVTVEEIKWILKIELSTNKDYGNFATAGVSISNKLQFFLNSSMTYYNEIPLICYCLHLVTFLISTLLYSNQMKENAGQSISWKIMAAIEILSILLKPCPVYRCRGAYLHTRYINGRFCRNYQYFTRNWRLWQGTKS